RAGGTSSTRSGCGSKSYALPSIEAGDSWSGGCPLATLSIHQVASLSLEPNVGVTSAQQVALHHEPGLPFSRPGPLWPRGRESPGGTLHLRMGHGNELGSLAGMLNSRYNSCPS